MAIWLIEVIPHCSLDLHFSNNWWCYASFLLLFGMSLVYLWRNIYLDLPSSFLFIYLFIYSWYWVAWAVCTFWRGVPCLLLDLQRFSPIMWVCLFISFMVSFAVQKLLSLVRSPLFIFIFIALGGESKKVFLWFMSECSAYVFLYSFIISGLTFKSLIHFEFIFVDGVNRCSNFILLHVVV